LKEPFRNEGVKPGDDNREAFAIGAETTFDSRYRWLGRTLEFYFFFRGLSL
jgi:hypothetical protein